MNPNYAPVEAGVQVSKSYGEGKVKFVYEGKEYALRISNAELEELEHKKGEVIRKVTLMK